MGDAGNSRVNIVRKVGNVKWRDLNFDCPCTLTARSQLWRDALGDAVAEGGNAYIVQSIKLTGKKVAAQTRRRRASAAEADE